MEKIKNFFGVGSIYKKTKSFQFIVSSLKELKIIICHFDKYPLITQKWNDYELFKKVYYLMLRGEHLTHAGLRQILANKASMNKGLSNVQQEAFPDVVPVVRRILKNKIIQDPLWISGFTSGEGCFLINIYKSKTKLGEAVQLVFKLTQHTRDEELMKSLIECLECGNIYRDRNAFYFKVTKLDDIENKIIPFFKNSKSAVLKFLILLILWKSLIWWKIKNI